MNPEKFPEALPAIARRSNRLKKLKGLFHPAAFLTCVDSWLAFIRRLFNCPWKKLATTKGNQENTRARHVEDTDPLSSE